MRRARRIAVSLCITMVATLFLAGQAGAFTLWYNGDLINEQDENYEEYVYTDFKNQLTETGYWYVYEDFNVTGSGWTIDTVWSNNLITNPGDVAGIVWEIRSGVSDGDPGQHVAGGSTSGLLNATGRLIGDVYEYTATVTGLTVSLDPGTYWLSVAPTYVENGGGEETSYLAQIHG